MRELKATKIDGKIYLFPIPVIKDRKYLIFCATDVEAETIVDAVRSKKVDHPDLISDYFIFLTYHTDSETKIFIFNPEKSF